MLFNSLEFFFFFIAVVFLHFLLPHKYRWLLLLVSSYYFYMAWEAKYVVLIISTTIVGYFTGIWMGRTENERIRMWLMLCSVFVNLGILGYFKYFNFFNDNIRSLFESLDIAYNVQNLDVILPIGISFYTFQVLSYSIDVYLGLKKPEPHIGRFGLFVNFFPQLLAGPIERAEDLLIQFYQKKEIDWYRIKSGLRLMLWGLFKKVVVADRLAIYSDVIYANPQAFNPIQLIVATYFAGIQVYCDFSGYSDIAIGGARVMGFKLSLNFRNPFFSKNITEFFVRWHITLFRWFNDYLYLPMAAKWRGLKEYGVVLAIFITFMLSGLWHGAGWNFVIWGALFGIGLGIEKLTIRSRKKIFEMFPQWMRKPLAMVLTFHFLTLTAVFFRSYTTADALYIVTHFYKITNLNVLQDIGGSAVFYYSIFAIFLLMIGEVREEFYKKEGLYSDSKYAIARYFSYALVIFLIIALGVFDGGQFIYFQF